MPIGTRSGSSALASVNIWLMRIGAANANNACGERADVDQSGQGRGHIPAAWTNRVRNGGIYLQSGMAATSQLTSSSARTARHGLFHAGPSTTCEVNSPTKYLQTPKKCHRIESCPLSPD
eukprot:1194443-Prorocentrum_minimum.AAC.5